MKKEFYLFLCCLLCLFSYSTSHAQTPLSGSYTIDNSQATGGTNYNSFTAFTGALTTNGISATVVANVVPGTAYNDRIVLGNITGSSSTNRIRINGNGATLQYTNTATAKELVVLNGSKYITLDSLNFVALSDTFGWAALINNNAQSDSITRCTFDMTRVKVYHPQKTQGINFRSATPNITTCTGCYIADNIVKGATDSGGIEHGVYIEYGQNITIKNNILQDFYLFGIFFNGNNNVIDHNDINMAHKPKTQGFYGIYLSGGTNSIIRNNKIHDAYVGTGINNQSFYGISNFASDTTTYTQIYNNLIYNITGGGSGFGEVYGIKVLENKNMIYHNTIDMRHMLNGLTPYAEVFGIKVMANNVKSYVKNNLVRIVPPVSSPGSRSGFFYRYKSSIAEARKNNYYVNNGYFGQCALTNPGAPSGYNRVNFQLNFPGLETGSTDLDPQFNNANNNDFRPTNPLLANTGENLSSAVATDMNGNPRTATPTLGALEWTSASLPNNGAIKAITTRSTLRCPGNYGIRVALQNEGTNTIDSLQFNWQLNGVTQTPVSFQTHMVTASSSLVQSRDTLVLPSVALNGATTIKIWINTTNGVADIDHTNDTLQATFSTTTFTNTSLNDTICSAQSAILTLAPATGYKVSDTLQWQQSTDNISWTDISGAQQVNYLSPSLSSNTWYRTKIKTENVTCYTNVAAIHINNPGILSVANDSICGPGTLTLQAIPNPGAYVHWYSNPTTNTLLHTGNSFTTPYLNNTTSYYVSGASQSGASFDSAGLHNFTSIQNYANIPDWGLTFDATSPFTLESVDVFGYHAFADTSLGQITIALKDANGIVLQSVNSAVIGNNLTLRNTIPLNFNIPAGQNYRLVVQNIVPNAFKLMGDPNYNNFPLPIPNVGLIKSGYAASTTPSNNYNYLYKWKIKSGCEGARQLVSAIILPVPVLNLGNDTIICASEALTLDAANAGSTYNWNTAANTQTINTTDSGTYSVLVTNTSNCTVSDSIHIGFVAPPSINAITYQNGAPAGTINFGTANPQGINTYHWDFGDGNTSSDPAPTHMYTANGNYLVNLRMINNCDTADSSVTITVTLPSSINHVGTDKATIIVYPNPAAKNLIIENKTSGVNMEYVVVYNSIGQKVYASEPIKGNTHHLSVEALASGTYFMQVHTSAGISYRKFSVLR
ncbi:hypothetical protein DBR32_06220 [Taibaiella sp. KBW10]|uniref:PKD domain-containing protein n=1 Tax=Taibaiella sp. KBW10 TaxID=2153357 RepID=UPI000F59765F|nr:PKD domain-containing protein [Taibaiella sp. KBW10]RQO31550.1 hypothetical protein DBR32_06220 [Taibaiella sp. KBW10]